MIQVLTYLLKYVILIQIAMKSHENLESWPEFQKLPAGTTKLRPGEYPSIPFMCFLSNIVPKQARSHQYGLGARAVPLFGPICIKITCLPYHFFSEKLAVPYHSKIRGYGPDIHTT